MVTLCAVLSFKISLGRFWRSIFAVCVSLYIFFLFFFSLFQIWVVQHLLLLLIGGNGRLLPCALALFQLLPLGSVLASIFVWFDFWLLLPIRYLMLLVSFLFFFKFLNFCGLIWQAVSRWPRSLPALLIHWPLHGKWIATIFRCLFNWSQQSRFLSVASFFSFS